MPRLPCRSKNADCGLTAETTRRQRVDGGHRERARARRGCRGGPRRASSAGCGSIPGQSGPRRSSGRHSGRRPNGAFGGVIVSPRGRPRRARRWWGRAAGRRRSGRRRRRRRGRRVRRPRAAPPAPTTVRSGRAERTSATQRSATGRIAGPLSPPGRPSGIRAGSALPSTTASAPASATARAVSTTRAGSWPSLASTGMPPGRSRADRGDDPGRLERLAGVEQPQPGRVGAARLTSMPATPGERPSRRASSAYSPSEWPGDRDEDVRALGGQPRQLGGEEVVEAGVVQPGGVHEARRRSPRRGAGRPSRASRVIDRVTKPPTPARSPYAASSRPVPPQPEATSTGEVSPASRSGPAETDRSPGPPARSHRTRSPRNTGPSTQARTSRATPSSPTTGTTQPMQRPVAQGWSAARARSGSRRRARSAAAATACRLAVRTRRRRRRRRRPRPTTSSMTSATVPLRADRAVPGDHGDRPGGTPRVERTEQVRLVGGGEQHGHHAAALAQPLGEREQRGGGVPLADEQAGDRLLGQRERSAQRSGDLDRGPLREAGQPAGAGADRLDDELEGGAVAAGRPDPVDPEAAPGEVAARPVPDRDGDEGARPVAVGDAGRDQGEVPEGADLLDATAPRRSTWSGPAGLVAVTLRAARSHRGRSGAATAAPRRRSAV